MPQPRKYATAADRARAYRERKRLAEQPTRPGEASILASLTAALHQAAEAGFGPARAILDDVPEGAAPEQVAAQLALWLEFQAAHWEASQKLKDRKAGWDAAWNTTRDSVFRERTGA